MVKVIEGNAIDYVLEDPDNRILLQCNNAQGKYASGLAKEVRQRIPEAYKAYMDSGYKLGTVSYDPDTLVANMVAQEFYGYDGKRYVDYDMLEKCLLEVRDTFKSSVEYVVPYHLCCNLAGGDWEVVLHKLRKILSDYNLTIVRLVK